MNIASLIESLQPFGTFNLNELVELLQRTIALTQRGEMPLHAPPGLDAVQSSAVKLEDSLRSMDADGASDSSTTEVHATRSNLQSAIERMGTRFGFTVKFADGNTWLSHTRASTAIRSLASRIASPESYADEAIKGEIARLVELGDATLKAQAAEFGVNAGRKKGRDLAVAILSHITKHAEPAARTTRTKSKATVDPEAAEKITTELKGLAEKADANPQSVSDVDADEVLKRLKKLGADVQKAVASTLTGTTVKTGKDAERVIKERLVGARQRLERLSI